MLHISTLELIVLINRDDLIFDVLLSLQKSRIGEAVKLGSLNIKDSSGYDLKILFIGSDRHVVKK